MQTQPQTKVAEIDMSRDAILARTREVLPVLVKNAERTDREGQIPSENMNVLREAGLLRLLQPNLYGGNEVSLLTSIEMQILLGKGCGSTAWVVGLGNVSSYLIAQFGAEAQEDVWGKNPHARICCVTSPQGGKAEQVEGGWRVSGRWAYASGSTYSDWAVVGVPTSNEGAASVFTGSSAAGSSDIGLALVPMSEITIDKTWKVTGMRGTASDTLVLDNVFVPRHRQLSYAAVMGGNSDVPYDLDEHPLYRTPFPTVFSRCLCAPPVGLAKAAVELAVETAPKKFHPYSGAPLSEAESVQILLAHAFGKAESGELHLLRSTDEADKAALAGRPLSQFENFRTLMDGVLSVRYSVEAIRLVTRAMMSGSFNEANPLQRMWRDCEIATTHLAFAESHVEAFGKSLLGVAAH